jgi:hypothetical protein
MSLHEFQFDKLEYIARHARKDERPFGGLQLILVYEDPFPSSLVTALLDVNANDRISTRYSLSGDFLQLPPVPDANQTSRFCFEADSWERCVPKVVVLQKVFRQKDDRFVRILSAFFRDPSQPPLLVSRFTDEHGFPVSVDVSDQMRVGKLETSTTKTLSSLHREVDWSDGIYSELYVTIPFASAPQAFRTLPQSPIPFVHRSFPVRAMVDQANTARLASLSGKLFLYPAQDYSG